MTTINDKDKFEILRKEYIILFEEINSGYNSIQNRTGLLAATYAFIFTGFVTALSQWPELREKQCLIIIESIISFLSFLLLIPAMFITVYKKWKSFGNPRKSIENLKSSVSYEDYYKKCSEEWPKITKSNKKINATINKLLFANYLLLVLVLLLIFIHINLIVISN